MTNTNKLLHEAQAATNLLHANAMVIADMLLRGQTPAVATLEKYRQRREEEATAWSAWAAATKKRSPIHA